MASGIVVRPIEPDDVPSIVDVHLQGFQGFFLSFLGRSFLRLVYSTIVSDSGGVGVVATDNGRIVAFAVGVTDQESFYRRRVRQQKWRFAAASVSAVMRRPAILPRLIRALRKPMDARKSTAAACFMSMAVDPAHAGRGIGSRITGAFVRSMAARDVTTMCLTTDRLDNDAVCDWYERLGFRLARIIHTPEGRWLNEYVLNVNDFFQKTASGRPS
jgi:ribosomal protein S18 acetylase RimI-like enzyme